MSKKISILGVCGSPRARFTDTKSAVDIITGVTNYQDLYTIIYDLASQKDLSNSEALMWMALFGAAKEGAEVDIMLLAEAYGNNRRKVTTVTKYMREKVMAAQGVVIATPVYFGDCSSYVSRFLEDNSLRDKVVGLLSVGAKRNGGQETTNIFTLTEALSQGAIVVGNGPPTSQYGGTGWAGDVGAILDDNYGLDSSLGTGKRVMEVVKQTYLKESVPAGLSLISSPFSENDAMINEIQEGFAKTEMVTTSLIRIRDYDISPCMACSTCPKPRENTIDYGCVIEDGMKDVDKKILNSDGLAFVIDDTLENKDFWLHFKVFIERTRHLRRDHFALADLPILFFWKNDIKKNQLSWIKVITYLLRQNAFICSPFVTRSYLDMEIIYQNISISEACLKYASQVCKRRQAVKQNRQRKYVYSPIGYA